MLASRKAVAVLVELILDLIPQRGLGERPFDALIHLGLAKALEETNTECDIVVNAHWKRRGFLEHHTDFCADQRNIGLGGQQIFAIQHNLALGPLPRIEFEHPVKGPQQGRFAAA